MNDERERFEERAFAQRFLASIVRNPHARMSVETFGSKGCPTKAEFVAKDENGEYKDMTLAAMWWAWKERAKEAT